jgi:hypothetical protein
MVALTLTDEQVRRIERIRAERGLASVEDIVSAGLDLLEMDLAQDEMLRRALALGDADLAAGRVTSLPDAAALRAHFASRADALRQS